MASKPSVVDFGAHFHTDPPDAFDELHDIIGPIATDANAYAEWFDQGGYDAAVLSQPYFLGHDDIELTAEANDELRLIVDDFNEFYGLAAIPTAAGGEAAAAEFERCLEAGYHGGALAALPNGIELTDDELDPVFEVADRTGAPIQVHPTSNARLSTDLFEREHQHNIAIAREAVLCKSISAVVHDGVLDRYPDLNLVYHHLGGNVGAMMGRLHLRLDPGRWSKSSESKPFEEFKAQLESRIFVDTSGYFTYESSIQAALEELSPSQVLLGTDAPFEPRTGEELQRFVDIVDGLTDEDDGQKVLGGNALDLLVNV